MPAPDTTLHFPEIADCGSVMTIRATLTESAREELVGRNIVLDGALVALTDERYTAMLGGTVALRTPMYCNVPRGICIACVGEAVHAKLRELGTLPPLPPSLHARAANQEASF